MREDISSSLAARLVASQFPRWANLRVSPVEFDGWDNATFRLGDELSVRLPTSDAHVQRVEKEHNWLPVLAANLSLPIPEVVAQGAPEEGFNRPWSICGWIRGEEAGVARIPNLDAFARDLAGFLTELHAVDSTHGPAPGPHSGFRGGPLDVWDDEVRRSIALMGDEIDARAAAEVWDSALASTWEGSPVWVHGDITPSNLLVRDGKLTAVIDFGCSAVGDPACDLPITWTYFAGESREVFRRSLTVDAKTWARARGWALWKALVTLVAVRLDGTGPDSRRFGWRWDALRVIEEVLG